MAQFSQDITVFVRKARGPASKTQNKFVLTPIINSDMSVGESGVTTTTTTSETTSQPPQKLCLLCTEPATFETQDELQLPHFGEMVESFCKHVQINCAAGVGTENWISFCIPCATFIQEFHVQQQLFQMAQYKMSHILSAIERVVVDSKILGNNSTQLQSSSSSSSSTFSANNPYILRDTLFINYRTNLQLKRSIHGNSQSFPSTNEGSNEISSTEPSSSTSNTRNLQSFVSGGALSSASNDFEDINSSDDESMPSCSTTSVKKDLGGKKKPVSGSARVPETTNKKRKK